MLVNGGIMSEIMNIAWIILQLHSQVELLQISLLEQIISLLVLNSSDIAKPVSQYIHAV